jgi:hypothetical protein
MASAGFSEVDISSDIYKNITNQTEFSPKFGLALKNPKFTEYQNRKFVYQKAQAPVWHRFGSIPSPVDLSHLKQTSIADVYASASYYPID